MRILVIKVIYTLTSEFVGIKYMNEIRTMHGMEHIKFYVERLFVAIFKLKD
jgi:hypothetical protein